MGKKRQVEKKDISKAYSKYADRFTPKPKYFKNIIKAFVTGGTLCAAAMWLENKFIASGNSQEDAAAYVVIILIMAAQLLTGLGVFDTIAKYAGMVVKLNILESMFF
ncbi:MAG: SpoVA/SpoVAEb family sporulation membrane protein [Firmicutes bacterium]|nr:SpoVA/SpoVAEb family sporulation membrane protein [Bacillota bacterium]